MFWHIAWFEIRYWLRSWMPWLFLAVVGGLIFASINTDEVIADLNLSNVHRNAPFAISYYYAAIGVFTLLMTAIFVNSAALRDFNYNTYQILFSTPVRRRDFLLGRFFGTTLVSVIPTVGVSLGIAAARYMPWANPEQWGPISWAAHLKGILLFAAPDTFFSAAILFAAAILWRRDIACFIAAILLVIGRSLTNRLFQDVHSEWLRALLDPFGFRAFVVITKYWTAAEKNFLSIDLGGLLAWNRLLWIAIGCAAFAVAYYRFSFTQRRTKSEPAAKSAPPGIVPPDVAMLCPQMTHGQWPKLLGSIKIHFCGMAKNTAFVVIVMIASGICILTLALNGTLLNNRTFPVTYLVIDLIRGSLNVFLIVVITYFSGALVWKDRDERIDEIIDATPTPEWMQYAARVATLVSMVMLILLSGLVSGVIYQACEGYYRFQFKLYGNELLLQEASGFVFLAILAFFIQVLAPNKYVGYFALIVFYFVNSFLWRPLNVATNLLQFAKRPAVIYSDFFGDAPYRSAWNWFTVYWLFFCVLLSIATVMLWSRGKAERWKIVTRQIASRFDFRWQATTGVALLAFVGCGAWIWYNTKVLNFLPGPRDVARIQADYEKSYKPLANFPQPRVRNIKYEVNIFPLSRNVTVRGEEVIYNPYSQPLNEIHFSCSYPGDPLVSSIPPSYDTSIDLPGTELVKDDIRLSYRIYRFASPLEPGEERTVRFTVKSKNCGFENNVSNPLLVQNGTFIDNFVAPVIGYDYLSELTDAAQRKSFGLPEFDLMPPLERDCVDDCENSYIPGHADWSAIDTVISTTTDQIAIAPGSLVREWQKDGRHYFEYKLDHPSISVQCFVSGRYEVTRQDWKGVKLEVYHLKEHPWNVARMMDSMKKSLDYYIENFGPYEHHEARIVEFPRVANFAQSFPGTIPYSEAAGFIADLNNRDDIDSVFYFVSHEMAHQWWAHQVISANMQGATLLSETLAQYSALMVMEKEYGRDMTRKFLLREMDGYLRGRGQERLKERPLVQVEFQQSYICYNKGSVALYYLKEMIGEDAVNRALRNLINKYAYAPPPYPTSYVLVDALREQTPTNLQYLIKDLFEDITLFSNRTLQAAAVKRADGEYEVTINVEARKYKADGNGFEAEVPVNDWIDIGAFAKPAAGRKYGDTIYRQRMHITQRASTFKFTTTQLPEKAGIDPFALLIDRNPDDNMKNVTLESAAARQSHTSKERAMTALVCCH
jgi:ABC-type transport system involved in multi-copper enzyme maturation permease subunit